MKLLGFIAALLLLIAFSGSAITAGLMLAPMVAPLCNFAARLWPPVPVPAGPIWLKLTIGAISTLTPAVVLYFVLRLEMIGGTFMRCSWPVRLSYLFSSMAIFVAVSHWATADPTGTLSIVVVTLAAWVLPASMAYALFTRQERKRREICARLESHDEPSWRDRFTCAFREALVRLLGYIFERGHRHADDADVFGKSASVSARESGL